MKDDALKIDQSAPKTATRDLKKGKPRTTTKKSSDSPVSELSELISITVVTQPLPEESDIERSLYAFTYTITIAFVDKEHVAAFDGHAAELPEDATPEVRVQLVNRHWKVFAAGRQVADVKGEGVVGQQPTLGPGDSFEYTSWTVIPEPIGEMLGSLTFQVLGGPFFDVAVPAFSLRLRDASSMH